MLNNKRLVAINYLKNEFVKLQKDPISSLGCTVGLINNNIFKWKISLLGPSDTPYSGGMFFLTADFPEDYPIGKPEVKFINKIYHLNVSPSDGHVCISTLNKWKPYTPFSNVITSIFALFYNQNPKNPYSQEMANEYVSNKTQYDRNVREWTQKYASMY